MLLMINTIIKVFSYSELKTTKNTLYENFLKNTTQHEVTAKDIKIAIRWEDLKGIDFPSGTVGIEAYNILYHDYGIMSGINFVQRSK